MHWGLKEQTSPSLCLQGGSHCTVWIMSLNHKTLCLLLQLMFYRFGVNDFFMASVIFYHGAVIFFAVPSLRERTGFTLWAAQWLNTPEDLHSTAAQERCAHSASLYWLIELLLDKRILSSSSISTVWQSRFFLFQARDRLRLCLGEKAPTLVPVSQVMMCMNCTSDFSLTLRRHHCHGCGRVSRVNRSAVRQDATNVSFKCLLC